MKNGKRSPQVSEKYWRCSCITHYIRPNKISRCAACKTNRVDGRKVYQLEAEAMLLNLAPDGNYAAARRLVMEYKRDQAADRQLQMN